MRDWLLELGSRPAARRLVGRLGLPVPMPQKLNRARGPWEARPLAEQTVVVGGAGASPWTPMLAKLVAGRGAYAAVATAAPGASDPFRALGEAYGRPATSVDVKSLPEGFRANALLFDATGLADPAGLRGLYDFFHPLVPALRACGRAVVLGRPAADAPTAAAAAARGALEGFVRSLAKEIGRRGSTAALVLVGADAAPAHVEPVLGFLLSARSAFVTGQPIAIDGRVPAVPEAPLVRPLERQIAVVTGAARGIGRAIAQRLAEEGAHVVCIDRPADDVAAGRVARALGGSFLAVDVADEGAPALIATHLRQQHGGVDVVVHNAGITRDRTLARMSPDAWDATLDVNLGAPMRIDQALLDGVLRDGGRIVCLASVAGIAGNVGQTNYAASKAGVAAYVRSRAAELVGRGITVNAVAPGLIETRMTAAMPALVREAGRRLSALAQGGQPEDVAEVVTFLASPGAAGLSGNVLRVCGGALMGA
jgi:3-oxoacyl-[acyl-carrier protein] reductase